MMIVLNSFRIWISNPKMPKNILRYDMRQAIPKAPLALGLIGLVPFVWGAWTTASPNLMTWSTGLIGAGLVGTTIQTTYGAVILSFMSGVLWGFATKAEGIKAAACYLMSVQPALWAFFVMSSGVGPKASYLMAGFVGLLILDIIFYQLSLTPMWWLRLRVLLTTVILICHMQAIGQVHSGPESLFS